MTDIQFDEEQQYQRPQESGSTSLFIRLILATGIVSTNKAAQYILLGIAVLFFILALLIPSFFTSSTRTPQSVIDTAMRVPVSH